ncbi:unnamed protein product [Rotaria magnacalcarata]|uniref:Uncharacterized protein n=1 Tax=Rotaria magnacalcarata TaxID=392030 RepID=A0A816GK17_9BILA|nr:unnamed protein product [Rotaria magnacalcarata]
MRGEKWIVITSIFYPTLAIHKFLNLTTHWNLIVIGDRKTPHDWLSRLYADRSRILFLPIDEQSSLGYSILNYLPQGSYARKNIGYLVAIACGARIIFESDDDNLLETNDIGILPKISDSQTVPWIAFRRQRSPFINIYGSFGHPHIWPRGFPIDELRNVTEDGWHSVRRNQGNMIHAYIQQYLADLDPDVDALYRLAHPLSIGRIKFDQDQPPIALQPFTFSPYNTQNTVTHYEAFWGLYLPVTTTFRVCDIWRGFWAQRLLWDIGGRLVFGTATVKQVRNSHSYIKDMDEEHQLYHQSGSFVRFLASWSSSLPSIAKRIAQLARDIAQAGFWHSKEIDIIDAWLTDLRSVGYSFPSIISTASPNPVIQKRAAVCVTATAECINKVWAQTDVNLRNRLHGDIDTFLFLSSSSPNRSLPLIPLATRLKRARSYKNTTVTILYEDRVIDTDIPADCPPQYRLSRHNTYSDSYYFQQLWALAECYNFVKDYEKRSNVKYQLFIHARADVVPQMPSNFDRKGALNVNTTLLILRNRYFPALHNGLVLGPIKFMYHYMTRWYSLGPCLLESMQHSEASLLIYLKRFTKIRIDRISTDRANAISYEPNICHENNNYS